MTSTITSHLSAAAAVNVAKYAASNTAYVLVSNAASVALDSTTNISEIMSTLVGGARLEPTDVAVGTQYNQWTANTVYDFYNAYKPTNCFVTSVENGIGRVYKCLFNPGTPSVVRPTLTSNVPFTTSDQYKWLFMWEVSAQVMTKFTTSNTVPVISTVNPLAVSQSIDTIVIDNAGRGYNNYFDGVIQSNDIQTSITLRLPANANGAPGFYMNCIIEITDPASSNYGEVRKITNYSGSTRIVTFDSAFNGLQVGNSYSIRPSVDISGSMNTAIVSAVVNTSSNSIARVIIHKTGSDYITPVASVFAHSSVGVNALAAMTVHPAPIGGHGSNVVSESQASSVMVAKTFANTIPFIASGKTFTGTAIVYNPLFANVVATGTVGVPSQFTPGERMVGWYNLGGSLGTVAVNSSSIASQDGTLTNIRVGDRIAVTNSTSVGFVTITSTSNSQFAGSTSTSQISGVGYVIKPFNVGMLVSANAAAMSLTNVPGNLDANTFYIAGATSGKFDKVTLTNYTPQVVTPQSIVKNSGNVLYINNHDAINTTANKTVSVKTTFSF